MEFVMNFPDDGVDYFEIDHILFKNGGNLYINFSIYMTHGGLFRMTSGSAKPEFVVKADTEAGGFDITDSNCHPETLKFLEFGDGDAGSSLGDIYGYLPYQNKAVKLKTYRSEIKIDDFIWMTRDDALLTSQLVDRFDAKKMRLEGVNRITIDPETGKVTTERLLDGKDMPKTYHIAPSPNMEKLYLFGTGFSVYDIERGWLKKIVEFEEMIKNWPHDADPYLIDAGEINYFREDYVDDYDREMKESIFIFLIDHDHPEHFYVCGNNKAMFIDAFNETYESVEIEEIRGDGLW
jgi:hypothetical protein